MIRLGLLVLCLGPLAASAGEADVIAAAEAALDGLDAEVRVVRLSGAAETAPPPLRVRFREEAPRGRVSAEVEVRQDDGVWTPVGWAYLEVAVFETAAVLTHDVARGETVVDAVRFERVETTRLHDPALSPDAVRQSDWAATRTLRAGTVLTTRHVEAPAAVEAREPLRVRYERGVVHVTLDCEARERGSVGESVRAYCSGTRSLYRVHLTAPGEGNWTATL